MTEQSLAWQRVLAFGQLLATLNGVSDDMVKAYVDAQALSQLSQQTEQTVTSQRLPSTSYQGALQALLDELEEEIQTLNDAHEVDRGDSTAVHGPPDQTTELVMEGGLPPQGERDYDDVKADAVLAADTIEKLTAELENTMAEERGEEKQEAAALETEFKAEHDELVGKLDKMRDKYFENHPNLDTDQRTDAEETFKTIKDDAVEALEAQQDSRLVELRTDQQQLRDNYEEARKELDGTRDQRA